MGDDLADADVEAEDVLEEIAQVLSHDLSNQLTTARSSLELARRQHDGEHVERTTAILDNAEQLVEDVVALARTGRQFDDVARADLAPVAERAWLSIDDPGVSLLIEESIEFEADAGGLRLLLENLFQNAVDHGPAEDLIRVGVIEDGDVEGFYVADDGDGFEIDDPKRAFESGHSTDENRSGLGLAITRRVADAHCWTITVDNSQEGGARFEFTGIDCLE